MNEFTEQSNSFQEFLDGREQTEKGTFKITNEEQANWALRKISQLKKQIEQNNEFAEMEISKVEAWRQSENKKQQDSIDYFTGLLAEFALQKKKEDPSLKTKKLPYGKLQFRNQPSKWNVDKAKVVKYLEETGMNDFIRVKKEPKVADIKKAFNVQNGKVINPETGEIIEGIEVEERGEKFGVIVDE